MIHSLLRTISCTGLVLLGASWSAPYVSAGPQLKMPDGTMVEAATLPFYKNRPKVLGFLDKIVDRKLEDSMALASGPAFCPGYNFTSWGGDDPVTRAAAKCQLKMDKQLDELDWPLTLRPACKCKIVVRDMTVLEPEILQRGTRFTNVRLLIKNGAGKVQKREGILEYQQNELVKQDFTLFNAGQNRVCGGKLEFKIGELGKFSGSCFGAKRIVDGGVSIACPADVFCKRHMVGNMRMANGVLIGFTSGLTESEASERYPDLPEKFELAAPAERTEEDNFE